MSRPALLGFGLAALLLTMPAETRAEAPCYVAFVHGSGENFHDEPRDSPRLESYWTPDGSTWSSFTFWAGRQWDWRGGCAVWRAGYDGNQAWWSHRAAGRVAESLVTFIEQHQIPDGQLIIIGHSMGGLVARYVVNNGMEGAPYYNEYTWYSSRMDYDLVRRKTAFVVTVQAPHTGTQAADALYGRADRTFTNTSAGVIKILGLREVTQATAVMTRSYLEAAGAFGGEMGDEGRAVPLYTVAGTSAGSGSGNGMDADGKLDLAWTFLCYQRGWENSGGAACRWDFWNFRDTPGDGLVENKSAHGIWMRNSANGAGGIAGHRWPWLDVQHNHNHGRYDAHAARIVDHLGGVETVWYLASYFASYGLGLAGQALD